MEKEQNPITPEELRAALAEQPYDLSGRLLVGVRLEHRDLEGLYLRGATLRGCTFAHCKFDNSDFTDADLGDTQFIRCKMEYCFFDGAKQEGAAFDLCARFGSTGIDGDTRTQSEVIFDDNIGIVRGVDMANAPGWRDFAWTMCDSVEEDYDIMLWELQEKFHEIDEAYPGMGAEIFNNGLHFLPNELRGAANYIAQGNSVEAAHQQAVDSAFSYGDRLPEHEMLVLPHSDVQKNLLAERAFAEQIANIRGADFDNLTDWLGYFDASFQDAVQLLLGQNIAAAPVEPRQRERPEFKLPDKADNMRRVYAYLIKQRCIDRAVLDHFVHQKLIYESDKYHNAVFVGMDEDGTPKHAHKRSTASNSGWRQNQAGSEAAHAFHHIGTSDVIYAFEAPIDMLSFISLYQKDWQQNSYVALCGVSDEAVMHQLSAHDSIKDVFLCLDNDAAGHAANQRIARALLDKGYGAHFASPSGKDWNDDLVSQHQTSTEEMEVQPCHRLHI